MDLHEKRCRDLPRAHTPLPEESILEFEAHLDACWDVIGGQHLERRWSFEDFESALAFVVEAGSICEDEWHHADFEVGWGRVVASIHTHSVGGLTEADFVLAAKLDRLQA